MTQSVNQPNPRIASLYVLRFVCVLLIVVIHFPMAGSEAFVPLLRTAVPVFFMTSGYFAFATGRGAVEQKLRRAFRKTLWITLYSNVIFGCLKILIAAVGQEHTPSFSLTNPFDWFRLIFIGNTVLEYLWYLTAYLEVLAAFLLVIRMKAERILFYAIPLFLIAGLLLGKYSFLLGLHDSPPLWIGRNFLTLGLPYFSLGYLIHRNEGALLACCGRYAAVYAAFFLGAVLLEGRMLAGVWRLGDVFVFTTPLAVSVFLFCLGHRDFGARSWFDLAGERHALNVYLFQSVVAGVVIGLGPRLLGFDVAPYAAPVIFAGSILLSVVINHTHVLLRR